MTTMKRTLTSAAVAGLVLGSALTVLGPATPASAGAPVGITGRASALPGAVQAPSGGDSTDARISAGGRYVIFSSTASLVPEDTDGQKDVYRKDLLTDSLIRVNATYNGNPANNTSTAGAISTDGRYVAFWSWASNIVPSDNNGKADVFLRDMTTGTTERISVNSAEQEGTGASPTDQDGTIDLSLDARYVTFSSTSPNFGADADTTSDIFVRDRVAGTTELISVNDAEQSSNADAFHPSISADGRYVAFHSTATNLVTGDTNGAVDAFVRDRQSPGYTYRVSLHDNESQSPAGGWDPWIDDSGTKVAFTSSSKLNALDPNNSNDVYVRNRTGNTTTVASIGTDGWAAGLSQDPTISGDGTVVAYQSTSTSSMAGSNSWETIYARRLSSGAMTRVSAPTSGQVVGGASRHPSLTMDGLAAAFDSSSSAMVTNDTGSKDVFFHRSVGFGPYNSTATFAQRQVWDFGGTTASALDAAVRNGASPEHALVDLAHKPAFAGKRPPLVRLYVAYFKRLPDLGGMNYWLGKLNGGMSLDQVSAKFAASSEFKTKYGNTTNEQFVKLVYTNVFNRQPDASGLAYWVKKLDQGMSRGTVLTNFSESSEGQRRFAPYVNATLLGLGMLDKLPTGNLLTTMLDQSVGGSGTREAAARVILDSSEYAATA